MANIRKNKRSTSKPSKESPIVVTRKFSGKPEDIERLMAVQRKLMQLGQETTKKGSKN